MAWQNGCIDKTHGLARGMQIGFLTIFYNGVSRSQALRRIHTQ